MNSIKDEIKGALKKAGYSMLKMDRALGLPKCSIGMMLHRGTIRYDIVKKIARILGKEISL